MDATVIVVAVDAHAMVSADATYSTPGMDIEDGCRDEHG